VRFYFRYEELAKHPGRVFDGALPMKIRDEIVLKDWLFAMVIPTALRGFLEPLIPPSLSDRVIYAE
jgi:hypothetical protein